LRSLGASLGFEAIAAEVAGDAAGPFSSTRVRDAIAAGDLDAAAVVLGRPHALEGVVEEGDRIGRTLGFPTANLGQVEEMLPPHGVYAVRARLAPPPATRPRWDGVMNVGMRPTVDGTKLRIEVHLLDREVELYGERLRVELVTHLRGEQRFDGLPALKAQIARDAEAARAALALSPQGRRIQE
jgi:riboflavin kinase / FMN adenylyltransferase